MTKVLMEKQTAEKWSVLDKGSVFSNISSLEINF